MSNYLDHAKREFFAAGWTNADGSFNNEMQARLCDDILELLEAFSKHGHSGSSATYAIQLFSELAAFKPIVPLTGGDDEWNEVGSGHFQNNRCSHVFKDANRFDGQAYDINAIVFYDVLDADKGGTYKSHFTCGDSHQPVTFPYTPKTEYQERK